MPTDKYIGTAGIPTYLVFLSFQNVNLKCISFESVTAHVIYITNVPT